MPYSSKACVTLNYFGHNTTTKSPRARDELLYLVTHRSLAVPALSHTACESSVGGAVDGNCHTFTARSHQHLS